MIKEILSVIIYSNKFVTAMNFYDKIYIKETKSVKECQTKLCFLSRCCQTIADCEIKDFYLD